MESQARTVICSINPSKFLSENKGKLNVHFEIIGKDIYPINKAKYFCNTEQVFVTSQFSSLEEKYNGRLFIAEVVPSAFDVKDGDCHYVLTSIDNCSELRNISIAEIFEHPLPTPEDPVISSYKKPIVRNNIFIKDSGYIYGPFEYKCKEKENDSAAYEITLSTPTSPILGSKRNTQKPYVISKINFSAIINNISNYEDKYYNNNDTSFFQITKSIIDERDSEIDFITDEQIIKSIGELIQTRPGKRWATNTELQNLKKEVEANKQYNILQHRFERFFSLISNLDDWSSIRNKLISDYFITDKGKSSISQYINNNKELYYSELKESFESRIQEECKYKQDELTAFEEQLIEIQEEIRDSKENLLQIENNKHENIQSDEIKKKIALETNDVQKKLDEKNKQLDQVKIKLHEYKTFEELQEKREKIEGEYKLFSNLKDDLKREVEQNTEKLLANMVKLKPQVDAILGSQNKNTKPVFDFNISCSKDEITASEYVHKIDEAIRTHGREIDYNQVANLLITIAQSQFTLFSGQPGTGKTSTAQLLGKVMGLGNRLLTVPVAKGWTSTRDILGFYNTLSQTYQPASSGVYDLLKHVTDEDNGSPAIILLDEFNLSQPEHYLSNFLEMADENSSRKLNTGEPSNILSIPNYIRFIGTLNSDETVQALSPRMLDRASFIEFDQLPSLEQIFNTSIDFDKKILSPINGNQFIDLFTSNSTIMPTNYKQIIQVCMKALKNPVYGQPIHISVRKIKAITQYCNVAYNIINSASGSLAIDYALTQHLLPTLNGHGSNFGDRLSHLLESLNNLPDDLTMTKDKLSKMIEIGKNNFDTYSIMG